MPEAPPSSSPPSFRVLDDEEHDAPSQRASAIGADQRRERRASKTTLIGKQASPK
jgi:hypothetical protein